MSEFRRGFVLRGMLDVLEGTSEAMQAGAVLDAVGQRLELNDRELSTSNSKQVRFHTLLRFASSWLSSIGWLEKSPERWKLTPAGREAVAARDGDLLYKEITHRYRLHRASARAQQ